MFRSGLLSRVSRWAIQALALRLPAEAKGQAPDHRTPRISDLAHDVERVRRRLRSHVAAVPRGGITALSNEQHLVPPELSATVMSVLVSLRAHGIATPQLGDGNIRPFLLRELADYFEAVGPLVAAGEEDEASRKAASFLETRAKPGL
jgi:hypothetical protein